MPHAIVLDVDVISIPQSSLTPVDLSGAFGGADVTCLHHDLALVDGARDHLSPVAPYGACGDRNGSLGALGLDDVSLAVHIALARLAGSVRNISPFARTANEMDQDFNTLYRAHYYESCTIISWSDTYQGINFLHDTRDEDGEYQILQPSSVLGSVYTWAPGSNHERLSHFDKVRRDIDLHMRLLNRDGSTPVVLGQVSGLN